MPRGGGRGRSLSGYVGAGKALVGGALSGQSSATGGGDPGEQVPPPSPPPAGPIVLAAETFPDGDYAARGWEVVDANADGGASIAGGVLRLTGSECAFQHPTALASWPASGVVSITARLKLVSPPPYSALVGFSFVHPTQGTDLSCIVRHHTAEVELAVDLTPMDYGLVTVLVPYSAMPGYDPTAYHVYEAVYDDSGTAAQARYYVDGALIATLDDASGVRDTGFRPRLPQVWARSGAGAAVDVTAISVADGVQGV